MWRRSSYLAPYFGKKKKKKKKDGRKEIFTNLFRRGSET